LIQASEGSISEHSLAWQSSAELLVKLQPATGSKTSKTPLAALCLEFQCVPILKFRLSLSHPVAFAMLWGCVAVAST